MSRAQLCWSNRVTGTSTKLANWKQSSWNNTLLNHRGPSVDIYERDTCQSWDNIFSSIAEDVLNLTKKEQNDG